MIAEIYHAKYGSPNQYPNVDNLMIVTFILS